jgi:hypothetical protein
MKQDPIVIVSAARTPMGGFGGGHAAPARRLTLAAQTSAATEAA